MEPAEIETALRKHPAVRQTVIVPYDASGEKRLAAYVVSAQPVTAEELRRFLSEQLPEYMVPSAFIRIDEVPLTANGKIDMKALPSPEEQPAAAERKLVSPRNADQAKLLAIWKEVLKMDGVGITDNFFELGGHSLLATQIISRIRNAFRVQMPLHSFLANPTVAGLAEKIPQCPPCESEEEEMARLLEELDGVSDEEAERLLSADSDRGGGPKSSGND